MCHGALSRGYDVFGAIGSADPLANSLTAPDPVVDRGASLINDQGGFGSLGSRPWNVLASCFLSDRRSTRVRTPSQVPGDRSAVTISKLAPYITIAVNRRDLPGQTELAGAPLELLAEGRMGDRVSARARSWTPMPNRLTWPCSVTTWCTSPGSSRRRPRRTGSPRCGLPCRSWPARNRDDRAAPRLRDAPRMKSTWPPMPEKMCGPIESASTWPVRSIWSALFMATTLSFWPIMHGSFVKSAPRKVTSGLSSTKS